MKKAILIVMNFLLFAAGPTLAESQDEIRIVGSSDSLAYVQTVSENFTRISDYPAPSIEYTGTGNGFRLFCAGIGYQHPDIAVTLRPISASEFEECRTRGVTEITEIVIGHESIAVVNARKSRQYDFGPQQLFAALAAEIPVGDRIEPNPYKRWNDIHSSLPDSDIELIGPLPGSGAFDTFIEKVMVAGCRAFPEIDALNDVRRYQVCHWFRKDGAYVEGIREANVLDWLGDHPEAFGIVRYALLTENRETIAANSINGVAPTPKTIGSGRYSLSRPIHLYIKTKHVAAVAGLQKLIYEFTSEHAVGPQGYLVESGFVPLDDQGRNRARDLALSLTPLTR
jgi:phosphate transport system substrate-binding protein